MAKISCRKISQVKWDGENKLLFLRPLTCACLWGWARALIGGPGRRFSQGPLDCPTEELDSWEGGEGLEGVPSCFQEDLAWSWGGGRIRAAWVPYGTHNVSGDVHEFGRGECYASLIWHEWLGHGRGNSRDVCKTHSTYLESLDTYFNLSKNKCCDKFLSQLI